jgi:hypothetical protein
MLKFFPFRPEAIFHHARYSLLNFGCASTIGGQIMEVTEAGAGGIR